MSMSNGTNLRILIATPDIIGPIRNGGIGTSFHALAIALKKEGLQVTVLYTLANYCEQGHISDWIDYYSKLNIIFIPLNDQMLGKTPQLGPFLCISDSYRLYYWLKQYQLNYDIVILPEWSGEGYLAMKARQSGVAFSRLKFIVNTHSPESWAADGNYRLPQNLNAIYRDAMERSVVEMADAVVSPSFYLFNWMEKYGWALPKSKRVIQNLIEKKPNSPQIYSNPPFEFVFFGRLETRKGLGLFCDALDWLYQKKQIKPSRITFLGKAVNFSDFDSKAYINKRSRDWSCVIKIITNKDKDEALEYLKQNNCVAIIPSLIDNSPYTVLECIENHIPFLASNVGGISELIYQDDAAKILFPPRPRALSQFIENVLLTGISPVRRSKNNRDILREWLDLIKHVSEQDSDTILPILETQLPLVSVCLVHYNRPFFLAQAVESLRQQSYKNIEVVLIDDGSPSVEAQEFLDMLEDEFRSRNWRIIRQENSYLGVARNAAARVARGEFLLFMDDDNIATQDEISVFVHAQKQSNADILTCIMMPFTERVPPKIPKSYWIPFGGDAGIGVFFNGYGDANAFWKKSVFLNLGGYTEDYGVGHEDWELFSHATLSGYKIHLVPEPLFWYRVNIDGMLRAGDLFRNHARNVRPYVRHNHAGLGVAFAYALNLHLELSAYNAKGTLAKINIILRELIIKIKQKTFHLHTITRQYGWRSAIKKVLFYLINTK